MASAPLGSTDLGDNGEEVDFEADGFLRIDEGEVQVLAQINNRH